MSLESNIERMWLVLGRKERPMAVFVTRSGLVVGHPEERQYRYVAEVGTYDRRVTLQQLRDDVYSVFAELVR